MSNLLLLYDTQEEDLARDMRDLLRHFVTEVTMIPLAPDVGGTLQSKEASYFSKADGALFLITPGAERAGRPFPSPSVSDEMGQAKKIFEDTPGRLIYLVDSRCSIQAVDQRPYIRFVRNDIRSVVKALTQLVVDLKAARLTTDTEIPPQAAPGVDPADVAERLSPSLVRVCLHISNLQDGKIVRQQLHAVLTSQFGMSQRDANFAIQDLDSKHLLAAGSPNDNTENQILALTPLGWEVVRLELRPGRFLTRLLQEIREYQKMPRV